MAAITLILGLMTQILTPGETTCIGFINESVLPLNVYIAGTEEEGFRSEAAAGSLVYLNGPGVSTLKKAESYRVVRAEGDVQDPTKKQFIGIYYRQLGIVRVESLESDSAIAAVTNSCQPMAKGDLLLPLKPIVPVTYNGKVSDRLTPFEQGLSSTIVLGKEDSRIMATGQFCFIGVGSLDGVKPGDHFTVYRSQPPYDPTRMGAPRSAPHASYEPVDGGHYNTSITQTLRSRTLPPRPLGDVIVVDTGNHTAAVKIINALYELRPGDIVVKR
jgi:hypothetical protein